ncbi:hypothetical protein DACRYDRAFT_92660 [Dacryopinax primogenitus]|uniref:Uncharacterized protein n=1 Tax=Dacryopinax primogenitus (strain DJM 731) TaxID=1858805 RepID=M5G955_DACPD|nr:uncharacterized protein DACRYDRAFT_92660 [Dacryopinax primogenitus]EJU05279.1 hypothetical protein DACRYDRAFT_92660 [Dacryopinax primogenitus]
MKTSRKKRRNQSQQKICESSTLDARVLLTDLSRDRHIMSANATPLPAMPVSNVPPGKSIILGATGHLEKVQNVLKKDDIPILNSTLVRCGLSLGRLRPGWHDWRNPIISWHYESGAQLLSLSLDCAWEGVSIGD